MSSIIDRTRINIQVGHQSWRKYGLDSSRMADLSTLRENDFWRRKFSRAVEVRDTDKSGDISRADFQLVIDRYGKLGTVSQQQLEKMSKSLLTFCDRLGLKDKMVKMSYDAFNDAYLNVMSAHAAKRSGPEEKVQYMENIFSEMFSNLDLNGDGVVTFNEWSAHYQCMGIDTAHARASFEAMDANGDSKVTKAEFVNYHYQFFCTTENKLNSEILFGPL